MACQTLLIGLAEHPGTGTCTIHKDYNYNYDYILWNDYINMMKIIAILMTN